ncbi:hypothetical protein IJG29_02540 [Candidatus Saccharibacteria bacterium]|nr:hypothetical protein [Candidatus Saccharibacteria bacterium]
MDVLVSVSADGFLEIFDEEGVLTLAVEVEITIIGTEIGVTVGTARDIFDLGVVMFAVGLQAQAVDVERETAI